MSSGTIFPLDPPNCESSASCSTYYSCGSMCDLSLTLLQQSVKVFCVQGGRSEVNNAIIFIS